MMLSPRHDAAVPQKDTFLAIWRTSHLLLQQFFCEIYDQEGGGGAGGSALFVPDYKLSAANSNQQEGLKILLLLPCMIIQCSE